MKAKILYRPNTDHERSVLDFKREYEYRTTKKVELVSLDTREGAHLAKVYGATQYPVVLVVGEDGAFQQMWQGKTLPLINDVQGYASQNG